MYEELTREWMLLVYALGTGAGFSFLYDQLLVYRKLKKHAKILIYIEDFFYLVICFFISFFLLFYGNNGILRFYMVLGCAIGIFLYFETLGRFYTKLMCRLIGFIMYPCNWVKKRLTRYVFHFKMKLGKCILSWKRKGEAHANARKEKKKQAKVSKKKK